MPKPKIVNVLKVMVEHFNDGSVVVEVDRSGELFRCDVVFGSVDFDGNIKLLDTPSSHEPFNRLVEMLIAEAVADE